MVNNELLLAISEMMDSKLEPIKVDIQELKGEIRVLKEDVQELKGEVQVLKEDVQELKEKVYVLNTEVQGLNRRVQVLEENFQILGSRVQRIELVQEHEVLPRLQNIEKCYLDTFRRYQTGANQIETMQGDIDLLKRVVAEHSLKLQSIS